MSTISTFIDIGTSHSVALDLVFKIFEIFEIFQNFHKTPYRKAGEASTCKGAKGVGTITV